MATYKLEFTFSGATLAEASIDADGKITWTASLPNMCPCDLVQLHHCLDTLRKMMTDNDGTVFEVSRD